MASEDEGALRSFPLAAIAGLPFHPSFDMSPILNANMFARVVGGEDGKLVRQVRGRV